MAVLLAVSELKKWYLTITVLPSRQSTTGLTGGLDRHGHGHPVVHAAMTGQFLAGTILQLTRCRAPRVRGPGHRRAGTLPQARRLTITHKFGLYNSLVRPLQLRR